jgi:hypothetical protein
MIPFDVCTRPAIILQDESKGSRMAMKKVLIAALAVVVIVGIGLGIYGYSQGWFLRKPEPPQKAERKPPAPAPSYLETPSTLTTRRFLRGWHDESPSISEDGKVVVWRHQEEEDVRICLALAPFTEPPNTLKQDLEDQGVSLPVVSGNGRYVFWIRTPDMRPGTLQRSSVVEGTLSAPESLDAVRATPSFLRVNTAGTRLAFLADSPFTPRSATSWSAVRVALLQGKSPQVSNSLSPEQKGKFAGDLCMSADGTTLVFTSEDKLIEARLNSGNSWKTQEVNVPGPKVRPAGISSDGGALLLTGKPVVDAENRKVPFAAYIARKAGNSWLKPERVIADAAFPPSHLAMTADEKAVVATFYDRGPDGDSITRTRLIVVRSKSGVWTEPRTLVEWEGYRQIVSVALSPGGSLVCEWVTSITLSDGVSTDVGYRKDLEPGTDLVNLSARLRAALNPRKMPDLPPESKTKR